MVMLSKKLPRQGIKCLLSLIVVMSRLVSVSLSPHIMAVTSYQLAVARYQWAIRSQGQFHATLK